MVNHGDVVASMAAEGLTDLGGRTGGVFGANLLMPFAGREAVTAASERRDWWSSSTESPTGHWSG